MPTQKFNGEIDGRLVKVIVKDKGYKKMWFAKPKNFDIETPHFEQQVDGTLEVHQDSADGKSFRVMKVDNIQSGSFSSGSTFASNEGLDLVVLPMNKTADGFAIDTSQSGSSITIPSENEWYLMGFGSFGPWQQKTQ